MEEGHLPGTRREAARVEDPKDTDLQRVAVRGWDVPTCWAQVDPAGKWSLWGPAGGNGVKPAQEEGVPGPCLPEFRAGPMMGMVRAEVGKMVQCRHWRHGRR